MRFLAALLLCVIGLLGSVPSIRAAAGPLPHDAYIWQRHWTPQLVSSVRQSADLVRAWRVLMAESDAAGRWAVVAVPWSVLAATHRPIVGVIRTDGRLDGGDFSEMVEQVVARLPPDVAVL